MSCKGLVSLADNKYVRGCIGQPLRVYLYLSIISISIR